MVVKVCVRARSGLPMASKELTNQTYDMLLRIFIGLAWIRRQSRSQLRCASGEKFHRILGRDFQCSPVHFLTFFPPAQQTSRTVLLWLAATQFPKNSSTTCLKAFSPTLTMPISRLAFSAESLAWAALTMMVWPNSRRIEPGGALEGSVGPSTSRILRTASTPSYTSAMHFSGPGSCQGAGSHSLGMWPDMNLTMLSNW